MESHRDPEIRFDSTDAIAPEVTAVITLHGEGRLAHPTARSLRRAIDAASLGGIVTEVVVVLDRPDDATRAYATGTLVDVLGSVQLRVIEVDNGDAGLSRNSATSFARGTYVCFTDGDNLVSRNWISSAVAVLRASGGRAVVHPEIMLSFGAETRVWRFIASTDPDFNPYALAELNYWDSFCATSVEIARSIPFLEARADLGFGYEDWHWNCDVLQAGIDHVIADETILFYRIKSEGSRLSQHSENPTLLSPTAFLSSPDRAQSLITRNRADGTIPVPRLSLRARAVRSVARTGFRVLSRFVRDPRRLVPVYENVRDMISDTLRPHGPRGRLYAPGSEPDWLLTEWHAAHDLEPELFPSPLTLARLYHYVPLASPASAIYWELLESVGPRPDYLFLVPWLQRGGGDQVVINYVTAVHQLDPEARIVVLATLSSDSPFADRLPSAVEFVNVPSAFHKLSAAHQDHVVGTLLVQLGPPRIHLINSDVGFRVLKAMGRAITFQSSVFLSSFVLDRLEGGQKVHYILDGIRSHADTVSRIFTDNAGLADFFVDTYDVPRDKLEVHYQVGGGGTPVPRESRRFSPVRPLRVLWAGRFDRQKRMDVLASVARLARSRALPIEFHAFGTSLLEGDDKTVAEAKAAGVIVHEPYSSSSDPLDGADFDVLLNTSEWEGIPLVVIKAAAVGIPLVGPDVGGMAEIITPETGHLVTQFDDAAAYVTALEHVMADYGEALERGAAASVLAHERHSWDAFLNTVATAPGYLRTPGG